MIVFYHSLPKNTFRSPESLIETGIFKFLDNFDIGVILFFVISGYCIAASTVSSLKKSVTSKWRVVGAYFLRRLRRIYPPYWMSLVFLVVLYGFASLLLTGGEVSPLKVPSCQQIIGNLTLTETWRPLLFSEPEYLLLGPAWSLCYEEQFYFLMGLMIVAECSLGLWTMGVSAIVLGALVLGAVRGHFYGHRLFLDGHWFAFALGVLVFWVLHENVSCQGRGKGLLILATIILAILGASFGAYVCVVMGTASCFALLLIMLYRNDASMATRPAVQHLIYCGTTVR